MSEFIAFMSCCVFMAMCGFVMGFVYGYSKGLTDFEKGNDNA